jgi:hypothetical protein
MVWAGPVKANGLMVTGTHTLTNWEAVTLHRFSSEHTGPQMASAEDEA